MILRLLMGASLVFAAVAPITAQDIPAGLAAHTLLGRFELMLTALAAALIIVVLALVTAAMLVIAWRGASRTVVDLTRFMAKIR